MESTLTKPDYRLAVGYGSAWHLLRCLGWKREQFNARISREIGASEIHWLDFPAATSKQYYPPQILIRDEEWTRIAFVNDPVVQQKFDEFWPRGGFQQNWDAIGKAIIDGKEEWLLVEAKAHLAEIGGKGTKAKEVGGRPKIRAAFKETLIALGHDETDAAERAEIWLQGYYQHANRLATLHFFTKHGIPARLIFIYFCGDQHPDGKLRPAKFEDWKPLVDQIHESLGLSGQAPLERRIHNVFMDVNLTGVSA